MKNTKEDNQKAGKIGQIVNQMPDLKPKHEYDEL